MSNAAFFDQVSVRRVGSPADAVLGRRAESPESGRRTPETERVLGYEARLAVDCALRRGGRVRKIGAGNRIKSQIVEFEVAEPARIPLGVRAKQAHVHLVEVCAAHIDAHRQGGGGEYGVHALDFVQYRLQRGDDVGAAASGRYGEVLAGPLVGHAFHQGGHLQIRIIGARIHFDRVGAHVLSDAVGGVAIEIDVVQRRRVLVCP